MELALRLIQSDPHQWSDSEASAPASRAVTSIAWASRVEDTDYGFTSGYLSLNVSTVSA